MLQGTLCKVNPKQRSKSSSVLRSVRHWHQRHLHLVLMATGNTPGKTSGPGRELAAPGVNTPFEDAEPGLRSEDEQPSTSEDEEEEAGVFVTAEQLVHACPCACGCRDTRHCWQPSSGWGLGSPGAGRFDCMHAGR